MDAATQLHALQPIQNEQRALDAPSSRNATAKPFWCGVAAEFAQHQRSRYRALFDGGGQPQNFIPMDPYLPDVQPIAANHRHERVIGGIALGDE